ncbi:MAG: glycosyltransferase family 39 protein [Verrucomicrobiaceae bacterium]
MEAIEEPFWTESRCHKHGWWLLLAVTLVLYLPGTATTPLLDRDEPRFAHATVEMIERGSWAIPYFNGEYRFDKPPLTYWWMRMNYALLGVNEFSARLHSITASFLTALVVAGMARRLARSAATGLLAGLFWLTSVQTIVHGRQCVADMPMILFVVLACRALVELLAIDLSEESAKPSSRWFWCLWLSLGAGFLAKGPVAWLVPALTLVLWRWVLWRKPLPWGRLRCFPGTIIVLLMVAAWGIPALIETKGAFWQIGIGEHVLKRGTDVFNGRKFIPGFYLVTTWMSLFPWAGFAVPAWRHLRSNWTAQTTFFAAWFIAPQIIFFFYATQLPHYVMPGYPGYLILLALAWRQRNREEDALIPKVAKRLTLGCVVFVAAAWLLVSLMPMDHPAIRQMADSALLVLTCVLVIGGAAACLAWKNGLSGKTAWLAAAAVLLTGASLVPLAHALRETSVPLRVAGLLGSASPEMRLVSCGYTEPSLVFHTDRQWLFTGEPADAKTHLQQPGTVAVVVIRQEWTLDRVFKRQPARYDPKIADELRSAPGVQSHVIEGFNTARTSWVELVLLVRP